MSARHHPKNPPPHPADVAVFVITTTLCAVCALMLPLTG